MRKRVFSVNHDLLLMVFVVGNFVYDPSKVIIKAAGDRCVYPASAVYNA